MRPKDIVINGTSVLLFLCCHQNVPKMGKAGLRNTFFTVTIVLDAPWRGKMALCHPGANTSPCRSSAGKPLGTVSEAVGSRQLFSLDGNTMMVS